MTLDERIGLYLAKCPPAVSGSDGHGVTFRVACALVHGFALDPTEAMRHLAIYNAGCCPPWKPRELRHKIEQAGKVAHQKSRGYLLGRLNGDTCPASSQAPKLVPVRLTPREKPFRTVGTVFSNPYAYGKEKECLSHVGSVGANAASRASSPLTTALTPSEPSQASPLTDDLISVPGCQIGRPAEIEMADADWLAAEKSGLLGEPVVQAALWMFGPGCTVVSNDREEVAA